MNRIPGRDAGRRPDRHHRPAFALLQLLAWTLLLTFAAACLQAHAADAPDSLDARLDALRVQLDGVQKRLDGDVSDSDLIGLRSQALAAQAEADKAVADLAPQFANVQARLVELGPAPAERGGAEEPDIADQRRQLQQSRTSLDAQLKLARLLAVEGEQAAEQVLKQRRANFSARLGERTASILATPFWDDLRDSLPRDAVRVRQLGASLTHAADATPGGVWLMLLAGAAAALVLPGRLASLLIRTTATRVPPGRLRRSLLAAALTLLSVLAPGLVAHLLRLGMTWTLPPGDPLQSLLGAIVGMVCFGAYFAGLWRALLSARRPSWRLPPIHDAVALGLRRHPILLAKVIVVGWTLERLAAAVNAGLATAVAINCIFALALGLVMAHALRRAAQLSVVARRETRRPASADGVGATPFPWATLAAGVLWLVLLLSLAGLLLGYVALGSFAVKQVGWFVTVLPTAYLLNSLIDDLLMAWLGGAPGSGHGAAPADDPSTPADEHRIALLRQQAAVLLSALLRLAVLMFALVLLVAPFGQGPVELMQRADRLREGLAIGEIRLQPGTVLQALAVLVGGLVVVRMAQRWLRERFLPTTALDVAMRESATTLLGYVGAVTAIAFALSAVGLGLERIAWVASALSVGIGFGLQAVVQNFVSGLILLAERPVKVGDWVTLGTVEGDIRRINVRATEIQMGDRSTVIVPNSEFITKIVRNVTHDNPLGLVQIKLPMPLDSDADRVRELILAAFTEHERVLDTPAPAVQIDGIDGGMLIFNATASVGSPRQVYAIRSALLFDVLARLRAAGVPVSKAPTMVLREGAPALPATAAAPIQPGPSLAPAAPPGPPAG